jgi:hypothetical protein
MNANSLAPQTAEGIKKQNWHRMDCLAKRYIENFDRQTAVKWFESQDEEWQKARVERFTSRLNERRW